MADMFKVPLAGLLVIVAGIFLIGVALGVVSLSSAKEGTTVDLERAQAGERAEIPPMDIAAPTEIRTATFALG